MPYLPKTISFEDLESRIINESNALSEKTSALPQKKHDISPIQKFTKAAKAGIKGLVNNTLEIVPTTSRIIEIESDKLVQQQFIENFAFAVNRYGFEVKGETENVMKTKSWHLGDEQTWLLDLSNEMERIFNKNYRIFQLMYCDFFDDKYIPKLWIEIRNNDKIVKQLAEVLFEKKIVNTPDERNSLVIIAKLLKSLPRYSLETAVSRISAFFSDLRQFENACERHLDFYGLRIVEKRDALTSYVPESEQTEKWRDEVLLFIAKEILTLQPLNVKLLIQSAEGDQQSNKTWAEIIEKDDLQELAKVLANKRISPKYPDFEETVFLAHLQVAMKENKLEFSLNNIETALDLIESEIIRTKNRIKRTIVEYKIDAVNLSYASSFVPIQRARIEMDMLRIFSERTGIDLEITQLLYYQANGIDGAQDIYEKLLQSPKIESLARLLVQKSFVRESKFTVFIVPLLQTQRSFTLNGFISVYFHYESLFDGLETLGAFLKANNLLEKKILSFEQLLQVCPVSKNDSLENELVTIAHELTPKVIGEIALDEEQHYDFALASVALFMRTHGYSGYSVLCKEASRKHIFATKVLFQYITLVSEASLSGSHELLKNAVSQAVKGSIQTANYEYFKTELADGRLAASAEFLFSQFKQEIMAELKSLRQGGFDTQLLKDYVESIRTLLYQSIDERIVRDFLLNQVLSAYLLTVPGNLPGIRLVESNYLSEAEFELSSTKRDPTYFNLIKLSKGGGKATRIGLVPPEVGFDDFSKKFNEIWSLAVRRYNDKEPEKIQDPLPCYLIRIFPSEDGLKEIMPSSDTEIKPLEVVRGLIRDTVDSEYSITLLSLLQKTPNGKLALIKVIQEIFDSKKSSLGMMLTEQTTILAKAPEIKKKFEDKEVDKVLFKEYQVFKISSLSKKITSQISSVGEKSAIDDFRSKLAVSLGDIHEITSDEFETLNLTIFKGLYSIGLAFTIIA